MTQQSSCARDVVLQVSKRAVDGEHDFTPLRDFFDEVYPMPMNASTNYDVEVGRIRRCEVRREAALGFASGSGVHPGLQRRVVAARNSALARWWTLQPAH